MAIDHKLDSHEVKLGDPLTFKVARDVMIGNYIVIPRGTPASGRISKRSGRGAFGKSAKLEFDIDTISLSSRAIPVSGVSRLAMIAMMAGIIVLGIYPQPVVNALRPAATPAIAARR